MLELLIIAFLLFLGIGVPFAKEPVITATAQSDLITSASPTNSPASSPASLSPLPEQFMRQAYPDTVQVWSKHPSASEPFVYRVMISSPDGKPLAEADYCLESYSDGLEWRHRVTILEYKPHFSSGPGELAYDDTIYQRLQGFIARKKIQGPISYFSVSDTHFMSPAQGTPAEQLSITKRADNSGFGFHNQGRYYWFDYSGNPTYAPEHRQ